MTDTADTYRCTLTPSDADERVDADRALAQRVVDTERGEDGLRVTFTGGEDTRDLVDTFVANESRCCGFFDFTVTETGTAVTLHIDAPADSSAQQLVDAAQEVFDLGPDAFETAGPREVNRG